VTCRFWWKATSEAMKSMTSMVEGLVESSVASFREVCNRLNQAKDEPGLQDLLDELIKNTDEENASKVDQEAYIVISGRDTSTITQEEAAEILEGKSVRIFGSVGKLAAACS
jgi:tRNA uridine 5-carbamoylmethylation protein Kti12